jgi:hypothetical protein
MPGSLVDDNRHLGTVGGTRELANLTQRVNKQLSGHPTILGMSDPVGGNVAETPVASGGFTLRDKKEREERSIQRATCGHCEAVLGTPRAVDQHAISTPLGPCHVPAAVDADSGLIQVNQIAGVEAGISKVAIHGGLECSLRVRVRLVAAPDMGSPRSETQAVHQVAHG